MGVRSFFSFFLFSIFWCISDDSFLFLINIGHQIRNALSPNETITPAAKSILDLLQLPRIIKKIFAFFIRSSDPMGSQIYDIMHSKTAVQDRKTVIARDLYREEWHKKWTEEGLDFVLTVPHAFPAVENGASEQTTLMSAGYTLIFNLVSLVLRTQKKKKKTYWSRDILAWLYCRSTPSYFCWQNTRRPSRRFRSIRSLQVLQHCCQDGLFSI